VDLVGSRGIPWGQPGWLGWAGWLSGWLGWLAGWLAGCNALQRAKALCRGTTTKY